jgi:hypothetical protein
MAEPVKCPACGLTLRGLPEGRRLLVTCPPKTGGCGTKFYHPPAERSTIAFRCSRDGSPFWVTFKRETPHQKFIIDKIIPATGKGDESAASQFGNYVADAYDIHDFFCPCCGYAPKYDSGQMLYVHCSQCRNLVCGGRVYEKLEGPATTVKWFVCYPACGHQGPTRGTIEEYQATRSTSAARLAVPGLPTPDKPPPKQIG